MNARVRRSSTAMRNRQGNRLIGTLTAARVTGGGGLGSGGDMDPAFFRSGAEFRRWLKENAARSTELWVGYFKAGSGKASVTWAESVDHALCYGWIDGIRKSLDEARYMIRFTPRKATSAWSAVNIKRAEVLIQKGLMRSPGLAAYRARRENRSGIYSYEQRPMQLPEPYGSILESSGSAFKFFSGEPASYRRAAIWWVVSAKKDETRRRRLKQLIADSARGVRIRQFLKPK